MSTSSRFKLALLCLPLTAGLSAQARPAIVQSVDLLVPMPPAIIPIAGKTQIVYELHVTNFLSVDVSLSRLLVRPIEALAAGSKWVADARAVRRLEHPAANSVIRF